MKTLLVHGGHIVTESDDFVGDILVIDDKIAAVGGDLVSIGLLTDEVVDARGMIVVPGGIDPHCHNDMPYDDEITTTDSFETGSRAAAHGGTTTHIEFAVQQRGHSTLEALERWHAKAQGQASVDYAFHMIVTDMPADRLPELARLRNEGVASFKLFTAYPGRLFVDDGTLFRVMQETARIGGMVTMHAENGIAIDEIIREAVAAGHTTPRYHAITRPPLLEAEAVNRCLTFGQVTGCPVYIVHLSCVEALEVVRRFRAQGAAALAETCPQYLYLDDSLLTDDITSSRWVMTPALRSRDNHQPLWDGLRRGDLQTIGTDHCPLWYHGMKDRGGNNFTAMPNGAPGIENRMALMYQGVVAGHLTLQQFVAVTSANAARIFGLYPRKGTLAPGSDADIVLIDPNRVETISIDNPVTHHMNIDYSAYEGMTVTGYPVTTIVRGRPVVLDTEFVGTPGSGQYLHSTGPQLDGLVWGGAGR